MAVLGFFPGKSDSATFYPLYPPNFMQKILTNQWPLTIFSKENRKSDLLTYLLLTDWMTD